jgi:hypothetical protein
VKALGAADQWIAERYVTRVFKPLALLSLGFATRVSLAELIPGSLDLGARKVAGSHLVNIGRRLAPDAYSSEATRHLDALKSGDEAALEALATGVHADPRPITHAEIDGHAETMGVDLLDGEHEHVAANVAKTLLDAATGKPLFRAGKGALGRVSLRLSSALVDEDYRDVAHLLSLSHDGHILAPAIAAGDHGVFMDDAPVEKLAGSIYRAGAAVPPRYRVGDGFTVYKTSDDKHPAMWAMDLSHAAGDEGARIQARALLAHGFGNLAVLLRSRHRQDGSGERKCQGFHCA